MTDKSGPIESGGQPPARGRGSRVTSRVLAIIGVLAVGGFGYLLGVRLNSSNTTSSSQGGFAGGPGRFGGAAGGTGTRRSAGGQAAGTSAGGSFAGRAGGAGGFGSGRATAATSVQTTVVKSGQLTAQRSTAGSVVPLTQSNVAAQAAGTVAQILTPVGSVVQQGQALVRLNSDTLQAAVLSAQNSLAQARVSLATQTNANIDQRNQLALQVSSAQAALATAQQTYQANQNLYQIGGIAQADLNTSRSAVDTARANLASAQNSLAANGRAKSETLAGLQLSVQQAQNSLKQAQQNAANTTVRAPFAGQVSAVSINQGENVSAGGAVLTLVSQTRQVSFNVAPGDASALKAGQTLPFVANQKTYQVKLDQNPAAPVNSVVTVRARLIGASIPTVGTVGTVNYSVPVASGTVVPSAAVLADGTQSYVFTVQNGQAKRQDVTVLGQSGEQSAVSGLASGTQIIASPPSGLLDGARVTTAGSTGTGTASAGTSTTATSGQGRRFRRFRQGTGTGGASAQGGAVPAAPQGAPAGGPPEGGPGGAP